MMGDHVPELWMTYSWGWKNTVSKNLSESGLITVALQNYIKKKRQTPKTNLKRKDCLEMNKTKKATEGRKTMD